MPPPALDPAKERLRNQLDDMTDEEIDEYCRGRKIGKYAEEEGSVEGPSPEKPTGEATVETQGKPPEGSVHEDGSKPDDKYARAGGKEKHTMELGEIGHKLKGLEAQVETLKTELAEERGKRVDAERYAALADRRQHYSFDLDEEVKRCKYEKMSVDQFKEHVKVIETNYRWIPVGESLALHGPGIDAATARATGVPPGEAEKYAKERSDSDKALNIALARAAKGGEKVDYGAILAEVKSKDGEPATT